jgi:hypothetical protein
MKAILIKQSDGSWKPAYPDEYEKLKSMPVFKKIEVNIKEANRSIEEHKCFFAFLQFVYENQEMITGGFNRFRDIILINLEHTEFRFRKLHKGRYEEIEIPKSLSFEKITQKEFHILFEKMQRFVMDNFQIDFILWKNNEWKDPNSCQNPDCHNPANHTHEIVPGHGRRQYCIDRKWQVRVCTKCHDLSHGKHENIEGSTMSVTMFQMLKIWCRVLQLDMDDVRKEVLTRRGR